MIDRPVFYKTANRARTYKHSRFDGDPYALGDFNDRTNVILVCSSGAVGANLQAALENGAHELLDFVGIDTTYYIANIMFDEFKEPRFSAPPLLKRMVLAGWNGRKAGRGFYNYADPANPKPTQLG